MSEHNPQHQAQFDKLTIKIASDDLIRNKWSAVKLKSQKPLTIALSNLKRWLVLRENFWSNKGLGIAIRN